MRSPDFCREASNACNPIEGYLLPVEAGRDIGIGGETDPGRYIGSRTAALRERLTFVAGRTGRGELDGVEVEDGKLFVASIPAASAFSRLHIAGCLA